VTKGGPFGRQRDRREGIITFEVKEQDEKAWTGLIWLTKRNQGPALVNTFKNLWVPLNVGNILTRCAAISFYIVTRLQEVHANYNYSADLTQPELLSLHSTNCAALFT